MNAQNIAATTASAMSNIRLARSFQMLKEPEARAASERRLDEALDQLASVRDAALRDIPPVLPEISYLDPIRRELQPA